MYPVYGLHFIIEAFQEVGPVQAASENVAAQSKEDTRLFVPEDFAEISMGLFDDAINGLSLLGLQGKAAESVDAETVLVRTRALVLSGIACFTVEISIFVGTENTATALAFVAVFIDAENFAAGFKGFVKNLISENGKGKRRSNSRDLENSTKAIIACNITETLALNFLQSISVEAATAEANAVAPYRGREKTNESPATTKAVHAAIAKARLAVPFVLIVRQENLHKAKVLSPLGSTEGLTKEAYGLVINAVMPTRGDIEPIVLSSHDVTVAA